MPTGKNWFQFIYVNLSFALFLLLIYFYHYIKEIRDNWPKYRCNPIFMPLADNIDENFHYCIQSSQSSFMGYLLQPLTYAASGITNILGDTTKDINHIRMMFDKTRNFLSSITESIFGVFLNLTIEFQRTSFEMKDIVAKQMGVMTTFLYLLEGNLMTVQSMTGGKTLGKCFHPNTLIELKSGKTIPMKRVKQGDMLMDGSRVIATMKIDNTGDLNPEKLYKIKRVNHNDENNVVILKDKKKEKDKEKYDYECNIYVTGSHMIYHEDSAKFVEVKDYKGATITKKKPKWFTCFITDSHKIQVGEKIFWDWEDYSLKGVLP